MDLSDAGDQVSFGPIPDGTFVKLILNIRAGGTDIPTGDAEQDTLDRGLFVSSRSSDAIGLDCELTVLEPREYAHRKIFWWATVKGGEVDEKGQSKAWGITKKTLRAILLSATATRSDDKSAQAVANQKIGGFKHLDSVPFWAKLTIEPGQGEYKDKNKIDRVIIPDDEEYASMRAGSPWPAAKPRNAPHTSAGKGGAPAQPAWSGGAASPTPTAAKPAWQAPVTQPAAPAAPASNSAGTAPQPAPAGGPAWLQR